MTEWNLLLREQLSWHWTNHLRERLDGLTDDEYFRQPAPDCWNVRPRGPGSAPIQGGSGVMTDRLRLPGARPGAVHHHRLAAEPRDRRRARRPATPRTSVVRPPTTSRSTTPPTAAAALAQLDAEYATWIKGVESLGEEGLARPCGPAEGPYAEAPLAALVLHIHRETIHHLSEVCLLRDLYRSTHPSRGETG